MEFLLPEQPAAATVAAASEWMRKGDGRPTFTWVHVYDPHAPYQPSPPFASEFPRDPYHGEVAATDAALAALLEPLLDAGAQGRTLVVPRPTTASRWASTARSRTGSSPTRPRCASAGVRAPPAVARGGDGAGEHVDIVPTVLDALSLPPAEDLPDAACRRRRRSGWRPRRYFEALSAMLGRGWAPLYGVLRGRDKLIDLPVPEMYDLAQDPAEAASVIVRAPARREDLTAVLARLRQDDAGPVRGEESAETRQRLAALGYAATSSAPIKALCRAGRPQAARGAGPADAGRDRAAPCGRPRGSASPSASRWWPRGRT